MARLRAEVRLAALPPLLAEVRAAGRQWLSAEERSRLPAMRSQKRRHEFLAGHWLIRCLAAEVLGGEPADWLLTSSAAGAPSIRSPLHSGGEEIAVSLSHCAGWVAAAIAPFAVGVDVECNSKARDILALAEAVLSPDERELLRGLPESGRAAAFYLRWTLKEAVGKRAGHGLRPELARRQHALACAASEAEVISWQFDGCSLAVAGAAGKSVRVIGVPEGASQGYWRIESAAG